VSEVRADKEWIMAEVIDNLLTEELSGIVGGQIVFRHLRTGRTIVTKAPDFSNQQFREEQLTHQCRFPDVWDAITSDRPYRTGWSAENALKYIEEQSGRYFDPKVVQEFFRLIHEERHRL
jgi:hypothetical protein